MKKILFSVVALAALAGCAYDYYRGGVRYVQDGDDCIFYSGEYGSHYTNDIRGLNTDKRVVYRNTSCADLFARDNGGVAPRPNRAVLTRAANTTSSCGCGACAKTQRYVIVPAM
ncbi:MAG: membrane lipoprotein lipid attachment site-containing protein [Alphaproteobacteria bacterium]|nr:membrane lipoprotein lipid attachment site-containing protein [Alphaproteobacteria bacterium]